MRIQTLESDQLDYRQQHQRLSQPTVQRNADPIIVEDRCLRRNYDTNQTYWSNATDTVTAQNTTGNLRPKSLTNHYPSSGTIRALDT
ncbi:unnamed protein product [Sphagnum balticum]